MKLGSTNISTTTVANALQTSSHDVGTLCTHANINKWAKGKPVSYATNTGITDAQRASYPCNHGYTIPQSQSMQLHGSWSYNKPTGGASSPYRLGDFRGYDTEATPPIESLLPEHTWNVFATGNMTQTLGIKYLLNGSGQYGGPGNTEISLNELWVNGSKRLDSLYLAAATDSTHYCIAKNPLSSGTGYANITSQDVQDSTLSTALNNAEVGEDIVIYYYLTDSSSNTNKWPMPVETTTIIHKTSDFFYRLFPTKIELSFNNYDETIYQGQPKVFSSSFTNAIKNYSSPSTGTINTKIYFHLYAPSKDFLDRGWDDDYTFMRHVLIPNDQQLNPSLYTIAYKNGGGEVLETINNSNKDSQNISRFPKAVPYGTGGVNENYYEVYLETNIPMSKFQEYSKMTGMPSAAYFDADFKIGYTGGGTYGMLQFTTDNCLLDTLDFKFKFYGNS